MYNKTLSHCKKLPKIFRGTLFCRTLYHHCPRSKDQRSSYKVIFIICYVM